MATTDTHDTQETAPPPVDGTGNGHPTRDPGDDVLATPAPGGDAAWVVLQTKARCEKKLAAWCRAHDITIYLPLRTRTHRYGARERSFSSPLFPGYVFALTDAETGHQAIQQREVARVLRPTDSDQLLRQLRQVRDALESVDLPEVLPFIREGRPVRINAGKLRGVEGVVERWEGKTRVFLNVEMIGQSVALEVDPRHLDPVE